MESEKMLELENQKMAVKKVFAELTPNFDIASHHDLWARLAEIGRHFDDAAEMARMINKIYDRLGLPEKDREKVLLAALIHDIGKSGPTQWSALDREKFDQMFPHAPVAITKITTVKEFLDENKISNAHQIVDKLAWQLFNPRDEKGLEEARWKIYQEKILDFWRRHADWTYEILKNNPAIDSEIVKVAASHHILEDKNPAQLPLSEIPHSAKVLEVTDKYQAFRERISRGIKSGKMEIHLLALIDKYQAFRRRSAMSHEQAVKILKSMVEQSELGKDVQKEYIDIIVSFENAKSELEEVIKSTTI